MRQMPVVQPQHEHPVLRGIRSCCLLAGKAAWALGREGYHVCKYIREVACLMAEDVGEQGAGYGPCLSAKNMGGGSAGI